MKDARPTSGKVRLALFNILGNLRGMSFLDLFSGTGQIARAAHSEGARVIAVESVRERAKRIKKQIQSSDGFECLCLDVRRAIPLLSKRGECFSVIFADPPYGLKWSEQLPALLALYSGILSPQGVFVLEHSVRDVRGVMGEGYSVDERSYGETVLSFFRKQENIT